VLQVQILSGVNRTSGKSGRRRKWCTFDSKTKLRILS